MPKDITTRICGKCGNEITIDRQNINNLVYYQNRFYHLGCFMEKINKGLESKRYSDRWREIQKQLPELQAEAKRRVEYGMLQDEFTEYLLANYDVYSVSNRFWNLVSDLANGEYKGKKCRPIDISTLMAVWKWGQKKLDKIAANNKAKNKGPQNDEQRLNYDLAIILQHVGDYQRYITQTKEEKAEIAKRTENTNKINYEKLYSQSKNQEQSDSILDLMNEIF